MGAYKARLAGLESQKWKYNQYKQSIAYYVSSSHPVGIQEID